MARKRSKRYLENKKKISEIKTSSLNEAIKTFKSNKTVKFDETLDISIMLNKEKNKGEGLSRGFAKLPNGTGKKVQVAVFATGEKTKEAKDAGADIVGNEDLIKDIKDGKINFDVAVATPDMMKDIAVIGEKLGPLGIMPNPKTGTVTEDLSKTIKDIKGGQIQFRSEKNAIVQAGIGKLSFTEENLISNFKEFVNAVKKSKPDSVKGKFINKIYLSTSMGPSMRIENIK
jgi:large subunit ribosomal protein L1